MLKWLIIGTLLYYAILLCRYRDSLGTWFTGRKKEAEQPESKPTVKTGNGDCLVGASRMKSKRKKSPATWAVVSRKWHRVSRWGNWGKWYRSFRLSKRPKRKNGKRYKPSAGRKQTCFIRWWNRLTGAGHGWRNFYKSMRYPYLSPSRLPEIMKWQTLT